MAMSLIAAASLFLGGATAQDLCACSPSKYTFTLDFSLSCPPVNVTRNGGIAATFCQISPFGEENDNITDLVPTEIKYVNVLELGQSFEVLSQQNITGVQVDGDSFEYASIVENEGNEEIPKVVQLNIFAHNAAGQPIVNFFAIAYTNLCDEFPTLIQGESAGWTRFSKLEPPSTAYCSSQSLSTETPVLTASPTTGPDDTSAPTVSATDEPTAAPIAVDPQPEPGTDAPTKSPTTGPEDTDAPTTSTQVPEETDAPTESDPVETDAPTMFMSMDMSMEMGSSNLVKSLMEWRDIQYRMMDFGAMSMSMPMHDDPVHMMSMSMPSLMDRKEHLESTKRAQLRIAKKEKSGKVDDALKGLKSIKSEKSTKVGKVEKAIYDKGLNVKSTKTEKSSKKETEPVKSTKKETEPDKSLRSEKDSKAKSAKTEQVVRRRRRLRVHRVD